MRYFEVEGNSPEEILREFLVQQKFPEDFVKMEIIEPGAKGLLGFGKKKAKVKIVFDDTEYLTRKAKLYISEILDKAGFENHIETSKDGDEVTLNILSKDSNLLIGKNATALDSMQYLVDRLTRMNESNIKILVDVDSYRERVIKPLKEKAVKLAIAVRKSGKPAKLPPMAIFVRREIHIAVKSINGVTTASHGDGQVKPLTIMSEKKYAPQKNEGQRKTRRPNLSKKESE